jgi:transcriptional regulator with XRE-family HTH domain
MATKYTLNLAVIRAAALLAGDTRENGDFYIARICDRTGLDQAVVSRALRAKSRPDVPTLFAFAAAYGLTVEQMVAFGTTAEPLQAAA